MSYKLRHTAAAIDYKLDLIDKNKNLLPYPYTAELLHGLEDVGDGSILTSEYTGEQQTILLNTCALPAGKYTVSLHITDILEEVTISSGFSAQVDVEGKTILTTGSSALLDLSAASGETSVAIYLIAPAGFDKGLLIKPQIEEGKEKTTWVPYMKTVGTYVDGRFNSTNAKIKVLADELTEQLADSHEYTDSRLAETVGEGKSSTVIGIDTQAIGTASHAEGFDTRANTDYSHVEGYRAPEDTTKNQAGMRGFSIINSEYSDINTLQLDSVEGIEEGYVFCYSALQESEGKFKAWRYGEISRTVMSVDSASNTITINEPLYFSKTSVPMGFVDGQVEHPEIGLLPGSPDPDRGGKFASEDGYVWYVSSLACKLYFWDHPEIGTSSVTLGAHAEGRTNKSIGDSSHVEGRDNESIGYYSHVEGRKNKVYVENGHAEGYVTTVAPSSDFQANGHAEGRGTTARGAAAHAEGYSEYYAIDKLGGYDGIRGATKDDVLNEWIEHQKYFLMANGTSAHAEGSHTLANALAAHAEGNKTLANGKAAHSEGELTEARGNASHAEGLKTLSLDISAHAEGEGTIASGVSQHVQGRYNIADVKRNWRGDMLDSNDEVTTDITKSIPNNKYAHIVGGGSSDTDRKNIYTLDWDGNAKYTGEITATKFNGTATGLSVDRLQIVDEGSKREGNYFSLAVGYGVQTTRDKQLVVGEYNNLNQKEAYFVVGAGTETTPSNSFYVTKNGAYSLGSKVRTTADTYSRGDTDYHFVKKTELRSTTNDVSFGTATVANKTLKVVDTDKNLVFRTGRDASAGESYIEVGNEKVTESRLRHALQKIEAQPSYIFENVGTTAVEHSVPSNAMSYAKLSKLGGYTRKSKNLSLLKPNTDFGLILPAYGAPDVGANISVDENGYLCIDSGGERPDGQCVIYLNAPLNAERKNITFTARYISGEACYDFADAEGEDARLSFEDTYLDLPTADNPIVSVTTTDGTAMLDGTNVYNASFGFLGSFKDYKFALMAEEGTTATDFEPYFEGLKSAKVEAIKSYSANLCPIANITTAESDSGCIDIDTVKMHGTYTLSCDITKEQRDSATNTRISATVFYTNGTTDEVSGDVDADSSESDGVTRRKVLSFNTNSQKTISHIRLHVLNYSAANNRLAKAENICLRYGTSTEYTPYFVDTYNVPEALQALDGYGMSINSTSINSIDFETKIFKKCVKEIVLTGNHQMSTWTFNGVKGVMFPNALDVTLNRDDGICTDAEVSTSTTISTNELWIGLDNRIVYWCGVLDALNMTESSFREYLRDRYNSGNPIRILYPSFAYEQTDVSAHIPDDVYLKVEGGGYIITETPEGGKANLEMKYQLKI